MSTFLWNKHAWRNLWHSAEISKTYLALLVSFLKIWESCSNSLITFSQEDMSEQMAYVVENDIILEAITRRLERLADRVDVLYNTRVQKIEIPSQTSSQTNSWVNLKLHDGNCLKTKLLVSLQGCWLKRFRPSFTFWRNVFIGSGIYRNLMNWWHQKFAIYKFHHADLSFTNLHV